MDRLSSAPAGGGEIWHSMTNSDDPNYNQQGVGSKYVTDEFPEKEQSNFDPDRMFKGNQFLRRKRLNKKQSERKFKYGTSK